MSNPFFKEVKKNFGFGCMRLPMENDKVDIAQTAQMVDLFMENGFNYFDTAHIYLGGMSETAIRETVSKRYPREQFVLTNKLSTHCFNSQEEIRPLFQEQLEACGVDYFDFYLMHAQDGALYE
ncbi:MAG: aldo/keto reductase, partial [Oscillospiraceae bacterium]|nr:aldo/keto reductase [Oscillospiraceae bacterium]